MATLQKIRSKGTTLIIILGLALFAFIAEELVRALSSSRNASRQVIGEIYGESVTYQEFNDLVDEYENAWKLGNGGQNLTEAQSIQLRDQVWSELLRTRVIEHEAEALGLTVTDAELQNIINTGSNQLLRQTPFVNQQTGMFDVNMLKQFLTNYEEIQNNPEYPEAQKEMLVQYYKYWKLVEKQVRHDVLAQKYQTLLSSCLISNPVSAKAAFEARNNETKVLLASVPYTSIKDSEVEPTEKELKAKYEELTKQRDDAAEALRMANEAIQSDDFKQKDQTVKDWNATINARLWMAEAQKASEAQEAQKKTLVEFADTYSVLLGGQKYAENEVGKIVVELQEIDAFITAEADKASMYENAQTIVGHLNAIDEGHMAINNGQTAINSENKKLAEVLTPVYEKAKENAQNAKIAFEKEESEAKTQDEAVATLNLPELRNKCDAAKDLAGKISSAKERIDMLSSVKLQREESRKNLAERKMALDQKKTKADAMEAPIHDAKLRMDVRKEDLDKQSDTVNKFASSLRLKLHTGDICPVCRQEIKSALPREEELAALVGDLQKAYEEAEKEHQALVDAKVKLDAEIKAESKAYERDIKAFNDDKSVVNAEQKALQACKLCGIVELNDITLSALDSLEQSTSKTLSELIVKIKDGETKENEVKKLRKALEEKRKNVESLAAKVTEAEKAITECNGKISTAKALVASKKDEVQNAEQKASELIVDDWQIDWKVSPKEFASALTSSAKNYNTKVLRKQSLAGKLESAKANVNNVLNVMSAILLAIPSWTDIAAGDAVKVDDILTKANALNTSVATALSKLKSAEESINVNQTNLNGFLAEHPELNMERLKVLNTYTSDDITRENESLKTSREAVVAKKTLLENATKLIDEHHTKKPELAQEDTLDALTERIENIEKQLAEIGENKGAINQELKTDKDNKERLGSLIKDADNKKAVYQKWSRLNELIGDSKGCNFRKIAQSYVLTSLIHSANSYMKTLTDRYTLKVTPGTFVISLEDAYQGFVSRAASTISGGESFLVSLSLALALSDIGQQLQVDTLFIDEGFGTLSGEPLQKAVETLRSLHSTAGRHVGIISHVEELQERIPVQIQVNQEGNNSSSVINIIP